MYEYQTLVEDPVVDIILSIIFLILIVVSICRCFGCCRRKQTKHIEHNTLSSANNYILSPEQPNTDIEQQQSTRKGIDHQSQSSREVQQLYNDKGLIKVIVPPGKSKGDKFRVRIFDGRTIDAVVPEDGISEFYMKVPKKKQNWHNNPLATLPMAIGPLF